MAVATSYKHNEQLARAKNQPKIVHHLNVLDSLVDKN